MPPKCHNPKRKKRLGMALEFSQNGTHLLNLLIRQSIHLKNLI